MLKVALALAAYASLVVSAPTVKLDGAIFFGNDQDSTHEFLGIPFAKPPTGDLRFRLPQPIPAYKGLFEATAFGPSCPQQNFEIPFLSGLPQEAVDFLVNSAFQLLFPENEDCLTINVVRPSTATPNTRLPVLVWIFGGGFEFGGTSMYDGKTIVQNSISMNEPVIFVSMNYRVTGFGFLASKEVKDAGVGNLGLQDQREALRWVQKYIEAFGGDPTRVTIWGESAGAISASLHMIANDGNTEGLFRAAVMQSGAPIPVGDITNGQIYYDQIVKDTGCAGSADTLQCLRTVPYLSLKAAIDRTPNIFSYQSLRLAWLPRADGIFITDNPQRLVEQGKIARIPFITGNCDDEGTLFSLSTLNLTTEADIRGYVRDVFLPGTTEAQLDQLAALYPGDITQGSPFDTGILNALTPQFKRIAAVQGDGVFQAPRRWFLQHTSGKQNIWVFLSKRLKVLPILGSTHGSDLLNSFFVGNELQSYIIRFASKLDPNGGLISILFKWPQYNTSDPNQLIFNDGLITQSIGKDDYRVDQMNFLTSLTLVNPV